MAVQLDLLEMNNIFVSTGDPDRDFLKELERTRNIDLINKIAKKLDLNITVSYPWFYSYTYENATRNIDYRINNSGLNLLIDMGRTSRRTDKYECKMGFFDSKGNLWTSVLLSRRDRDNRTALEPTFEFTKFRRSNIYHGDDITFLNSEYEISEILKNNYPYAYKLCEEHKLCKTNMLMSPQLEQLYKAGFSFAERFAGYSYNSSTSIACFNRLCKKGKNIEEIMKTPKKVWILLKEKNDIQYWDVIRKLYKLGKISDDTLKMVIESNYDESDVECIRRILQFKYNDKRVFSFEKLQNYLRRLDMYEAIPAREAFYLLRDYLRICSALEMEPKVDGDSLKREHDVAARNLRQKEAQDRANKYREAFKYLAKYNYSDEKYFIRGVKDYDDLLDEANQQHNCVAGYANSIMRQESLIYFLRKKDQPDKSYITIELSPNLRGIRQRYLAYNQPVRDKEITDFLDKWLEYIKFMEEDEL